MLVQGGAGFLELCIARAPRMACARAFSWFDLWPFAMPTPLAWQRPSSLVRTRVERQAESGWRKGCQCVTSCWLCGPCRKLVMWLWWNCGGMPSTSLCAFRLCCTIGIVDFQWASGGRSKNLGEWAYLRNRMVLFWVCSGPSLPAQLLVHWVYKKWLSFFYLIDIFHVVYKVNCAHLVSLTS